MSLNLAFVHPRFANIVQHVLLVLSAHMDDPEPQLIAEAMAAFHDITIESSFLPSHSLQGRPLMG